MELPKPEDKELTKEERDAEAMKHATPYSLAKKVNPLDGLPDYLKEPKNFMKVQKALLETMTCGKSHSDPMEMTKCKKCTDNMIKRRQLMAKLGFKSVEQYMAWKKTHTEIRQRMPLVDWDKGEVIK